MAILDVLLTDGHYKHTYAIARALHFKGLKVGVISHRRLSITFFSRFISKRFIVESNIYDDDVVYKNEIVKILQSNRCEVLMPVGNRTFNIVSKHKGIIENYSKVVVCNYETMCVAQNKANTFLWAKKNGVKIPRTIFLQSISDIHDVSCEVNYPVVIKKVNPNETGVIYCNNKKELIKLYKSAASKSIQNGDPPILQEYISGSGVGFYGLYNHGDLVASFMHERVHEYPTTGGASTLAKSSYNNDLRKIGSDILSKLKWHGVAMVEFKKTNNGELFLIEINPKFWGSLELSYYSGLNFPHLLYLLAKGETLPKQPKYKNDIYFRWTIPHDIMWLFHAGKNDRKTFKRFKKNEQIYTSTHYDDPMVIVFNILFLVFKIFKDKKYPHSKVEKIV